MQYAPEIVRKQKLFVAAMLAVQFAPSGVAIFGGLPEELASSLKVSEDLIV
jgi:hypothetical protein